MHAQKSNAIDLETSVPPAWNLLTGSIVSCTMTVHAALGPGLPERLYEEALLIELSLTGHQADRQRTIRLGYRGRELSPLILDMVVDELVVVELKSVDAVHPAHLAQLNSYMRAAQLPLGLLLNFGQLLLKDGVHRRINPLAPALARFRRNHITNGVPNTRW